MLLLAGLSEPVAEEGRDSAEMIAAESDAIRKRIGAVISASLPPLTAANRAEKRIFRRN
ncbi:hypothetical protein [Rhodovulum sulfidophilum]|uniref:hypothetical protein n=1 Tax=Rhodovulum sulfidophilum TaxID=35806 RepID=UPI0015BFF449|nr:hypothetical protein [Rhodovulum sulfidophilum]MBL3551334.1 hypothetical protein [Rhodovulum sulfidophilum]